MLRKVTVQQYNRFVNELKSKLTIVSINIQTVSEDGQEVHLKGWGVGLYPETKKEVIDAIADKYSLEVTYWSTVDDKDCHDRFWMQIKSL